MDTASPSPTATTRHLFAQQPPVITILSDHASHDRDKDKDKLSVVAEEADRDRLQLDHHLRSIFDILRHKNTRLPAH